MAVPSRVAERRLRQAALRRRRRLMTIVGLAVLVGAGAGSAAAWELTSGAPHRTGSAQVAPHPVPPPPSRPHHPPPPPPAPTRPVAPVSGHSALDRTLLARLIADVGRTSGASVGASVRVLSTGEFVESGPLDVAAAWSTLKVPLVMARMRAAETHHESAAALAAIKDAATSAITQSDNYAAARLFTALEQRTSGLIPASRYIQSELTLGGDSTTEVTTAPPPPGAFSTWGQTKWSLAAGTEFYRQLARRCVPPASGTELVLSLMQRSVPDQRWGIGSVSWPGASTVAFKGGWGPLPAPGYLVRQFGIVETSDGRGVVVGLIAHASSFGTGIEVLDRLAAAVTRSVRIARTAPARPCS